MEFVAKRNNGVVGKFTDSCFWIAAFEALRIFCSGTLNLLEVRSVERLRSLCDFIPESIELDTARDHHNVQILCDIFNVNIVFYRVITLPSGEQCLDGRPDDIFTNSSDEDNPVAWISIASYGAHFQLIVSATGYSDNIERHFRERDLQRSASLAEIIVLPPPPRKPASAKKRTGRKSTKQSSVVRAPSPSYTTRRRSSVSHSERRSAEEIVRKRYEELRDGSEVSESLFDEREQLEQIDITISIYEGNLSAAETERRRLRLIENDLEFRQSYVLSRVRSLGDDAYYRSNGSETLDDLAPLFSDLFDSKRRIDAQVDQLAEELRLLNLKKQEIRDALLARSMA